MLRPVELDAAGNPRPGQADERGLDDVLVVNQIVAVGLVLNGVDAPADFRQHQHAEKFVFDPDRLPFRSTGFSAMRSVNGSGYTLPLLP
jgi:hypothetical protein